MEDQRGSQAGPAARDYNALLDHGRQCLFPVQAVLVRRLPFAEAVSTMTDMTWPEYRQMMLDGAAARRQSLDQGKPGAPRARAGNREG
jgi:protocatechuate 4,5-dioxygenase alpha chain